MAARLTRRLERRGTILDVATACFLVDGNAATSISTIAVRLGGSKGALYNDFKNKEDLFAAMKRFECGKVQTVMFAAIPPRRRHEATLTRCARSFVERPMSPPAIAIHRLVMAGANWPPSQPRP